MVALESSKGARGVTARSPFIDTRSEIFAKFCQTCGRIRMQYYPPRNSEKNGWLQGYL